MRTVPMGGGEEEGVLSVNHHAARWSVLIYVILSLHGSFNLVIHIFLESRNFIMDVSIHGCLGALYYVVFGRRA